MAGSDVYKDLHAGDINEALSPILGLEQTGDAPRDASAEEKSYRGAPQAPLGWAVRRRR
jgi:hypothetical protein